MIRQIRIANDVFSRVRKMIRPIRGHRSVWVSRQNSRLLLQLAAPLRDIVISLSASSAIFSASIREGRVALSVGHPRGTHSRYMIGCCLIPLGICGLKNSSRRITYGIGCVRRMPSLSPLSSLGGKWIVAKIERFVLTRRAGSVLWWMTLSDYFGTQSPV